MASFMLGKSNLNTSYEYLSKDQLLTGTFGSCVSLVHVRGKEKALGSYRGGQWCCVNSVSKLSSNTVH